MLKLKAKKIEKKADLWIKKRNWYLSGLIFDFLLFFLVLS